MKRTTNILIFGIITFFGLALSTNAQYVPYTYAGSNNYSNSYYGSYNSNNNCVITQTYPYTYNCNNYNNTYNNSYTYTSGCYTYSYNAYTRQLTIISYNCQQRYVQPTTYTYTFPAQYQSYYTQPNHTYQYSHGSWYIPSQYNSMNQYYGYTNGYTNTNYNNGYSNNCYWQNGYQICY